MNTPSSGSLIKYGVSPLVPLRYFIKSDESSGIAALNTTALPSLSFIVIGSIVFVFPPTNFDCISVSLENGSLLLIHQSSPHNAWTTS